MTSRDEVTTLASQTVGHLAPGLLVRTQESRFWSTTPDDEVLHGIAVSAGIDITVGRQPGALYVKSTYNIDALRRTQRSDVPTDEMPAEGWRCSVVIHGQWQTDDSESLSDDALRAFAVKVGLMALHPYARAHVQSAVAAAGWPTYTLDVLTQQDDLFSSEEDPDEIDLDLVTVS